MLYQIKKIKLIIKLAIVVAVILLLSCGHSPVHINTPQKLPQPKPLDEINIALVLGGGGARGAAHVGALSVLEENQIPIDLIVGSSAGSIIGALYADTPNSEVLKQRTMNLKKWDVLDPTLHSGISMLWTIGGIVEGFALKNFLKNNLSTYDFSQLKIPLVVVTTDIERGELFNIRSGPIIPAVHASSAIPLIFKPVKIYDRVLVDGGVISPVPVEVAKALGAKYIIAVDINDVLEPVKVKGSYQLADRTMWLSYIALSNWQNQQADVLIKPKFKLGSMFDDNHFDEFYHLGRAAALKVLPELKALTKNSH